MIILPDVTDVALAGYVVLAVHEYRRRESEHGIDAPPGLDKYEAVLRALAKTGHMETTPAAVAETLNDQSEPLLLTKAEAARMMSMSTKTLERRIADGVVPAVHIGASVRIRRADVERLAGLTPPPEGTTE